MIQIKNKYIVVGIAVSLLLVYLLGGYLGRLKANRDSVENTVAYIDSIKIYKYKLDSLEKVAYEKTQLIIEQKQAIELGLLKQAELKALNLKKVSEVTSLKAQIKILSDSVEHTGEVIVIHDTVTGEDHNVLYLPVGFQEKTKHYELYGEFDTNANLSLDLTVPVDLDIFTGYDRKLKSYKAVVTSDNPYFKVSEIKSIKVEAKKPSRITFGAQAGYGIILGKPLSTAPYVGLGVSYRF